MSSSEMLITQLLEIQSYPVESFPLYFVSPEDSAIAAYCMNDNEQCCTEICSVPFTLSAVDFFQILHAMQIHYTKESIQQILSDFPNSMGIYITRRAP